MSLSRGLHAQGDLMIAVTYFDVNTGQTIHGEYASGVKSKAATVIL
jgi:hypothetical protein